VYLTIKRWFSKLNGRAGGEAQVVEYLPSLSSNPSITKKNKNKKK
jgi:hypothetical protein